MSNAAPPIAGSVSGPWLYGRWLDVFFGYGLAYLLSIPLLLFLTTGVDANHALALATPYLALAFSTPHYGATLLRVYERGEDRRKYAIFSIWVTLGMVALFAAGLYSAFVGSLLLTVYVSWSPWHFSGQNYGISVMYLGRSGVKLPAEVKRLLYVSYVLSAVLAFVSIHMGGTTLSFAAGPRDPTGTLRVLQLGIDPPLALTAVGVLGAAWLGCLGVVGFRLLKLAPASSLVPVVVLAATQSLWFTLPAVGRLTQVWTAESIPFSAIWLSVAHSIQYLWVTCYYVQRGESPVRTPRFLTKCLLAGAALSAPALLFAPGLMGPAFPNGVAVPVLLFSSINLHHFLLDGAIWKLRDGRIARTLLRSESVAPAPIGAAPRRAWLRPVLLGVGALCLVFQLALGHLGRLAGSTHVDPNRSLDAALQLSAFGGDSPALWSAIGGRLEEAGEPDKAIGAYRRAIQMNGAAVDPLVFNRLAWLLLERHADDPAAVDEARRASLQLVRRVGERRPEPFQTLAAAFAAAERWEDASRAAERALALARAQSDTRRAEYIEQTLTHYRSRAATASPLPE
jgi:hypothetical protein